MGLHQAVKVVSSKSSIVFEVAFIQVFFIWIWPHYKYWEYLRGWTVLCVLVDPSLSRHALYFKVQLFTGVQPHLSCPRGGCALSAMNLLCSGKSGLWALMSMQGLFQILHGWFELYNNFLKMSYFVKNQFNLIRINIRSNHSFLNESKIGIKNIEDSIKYVHISDEFDFSWCHFGINIILAVNGKTLLSEFETWQLLEIVPWERNLVWILKFQHEYFLTR